MELAAGHSHQRVSLLHVANLLAGVALDILTMSLAPVIIPNRLCKLLAGISGALIVVQVVFFYVANHPYHKGFVDCLLGRCSEEMLNETFFLLCVFLCVSSVVVMWFGWERTFGDVWAWLHGNNKAMEDETLINGIRQGREAFLKRFGSNSSASDEAMLSMYKQQKQESQPSNLTEGQLQAIMRKGMLDGVIQIREQRKAAGLTGREIAESVLANEAMRLCDFLNDHEYITHDESEVLYNAWDDMVEVLINPLNDKSYPNEKEILTRYKNWHKVLESFDKIATNGHLAFLLGGLTFSAEEFIIQSCVRGTETTDLNMQTAWLGLLKKIKEVKAPDAIRIPSSVF